MLLRRRPHGPPSRRLEIAREGGLYNIGDARPSAPSAIPKALEHLTGQPYPRSGKCRGPEMVRSMDGFCSPEVGLQPGHGDVLGIHGDHRIPQLGGAAGREAPGASASSPLCRRLAGHAPTSHLTTGAKRLARIAMRLALSALLIRPLRTEAGRPGHPRPGSARPRWQDSAFASAGAPITARPDAHRQATDSMLPVASPGRPAPPGRAPPPRGLAS